MPAVAGGQARGMPSTPLTRQPAPSLEVETLDHGAWSLAHQQPETFTLVDDLIAAVDFAVEKDHPARGELEPAAVA
jgi:hypothetical protein